MLAPTAEALDLRIVKTLLLILLVALLVPYVVAPFYRTGHPVSTLMAWRKLTGAPMSRQWIDLALMSPYLPRSVVASEDAHFCKHHGIDLGALREAMQDAQEGEALRGASTITQQVAKNLFLWQAPGALRRVLDPIRKLFEFPLAIWIDLVLPKQRILEIYLNIADTGAFRAVRRGGRLGVCLRPFGGDLVVARGGDARASILPNPVKRSARNPGPACGGSPGVYTARANVVTTCWGEKRGF